MSPALFNGGALEAEALLHSRALHYGDGLFRTLLVWNGHCRDWPWQYARLQADADRLQLDLPDVDRLQAEAAQLTSGQTRAVLKILLWRTATGRGYAPGTRDSERLLMVSQAPLYTAASWEQGIVACRSPVTLGSQPALAGVKHLNRLDQVLASRDWPDAVSEALMADAHGHVTCGTRTNLFWTVGAKVFTPPLHTAGVSGAMRSRILDACRRLGIDCAEKQVTWSALALADEVFVTNSLIGLWPVRVLEARTWAAPGPLSLRLQADLNHPRLC